MAFLRPLTASILLASLVLAGCSDNDTGSKDDELPQVTPYSPVAYITVADHMTFHQSVVDPAVGIAADLYEPTMEVSPTGVLYVAAHVIGAATTGTPAYYSPDDGESWEQLPFLGPVSLPSPIQNGQPPPGDEGFIVYGDDGRVWMSDIYAAGYTITGWCNDGTEQCYDNRYAYDRVETANSDCQAVASLNDRPWAAYGPGTGMLLLVNNPGGGPMQIGLLNVPPSAPVGAFDPMTGPTWNLCASPDGWIPGIPDMREDGFFAVPQITGNGDDERLTVVSGYAPDIFEVKVTDAFHVQSSYGGTSNGGRTAFDLEGSLFVGAYNNTEGTLADNTIQGQFVLAASTDDAETFVPVTFVTDRPVRSLYLDSNMNGPGALLTWSQLGSDNAVSDWFVAHVFVGPNGEPVLEHVTRAVKDGPHSSAHVMGAAAGPDGRAYFVNFQGSPLAEYAGSTPISVWIQDSGPTLPMAAGNSTMASAVATSTPAP